MWAIASGIGGKADIAHLGGHVAVRPWLCKNALYVIHSRSVILVWRDRVRRFVEGIDRGQATLFPECLADWIEENNSVRVIDAFVDKLDLSRLGFEGVTLEATGRPSYHPAVLLKLYIYGYLNRVQSSRERLGAMSRSFG